ncbi:MAG: hypothetical protein GC182_08810 [Rhodopseudomonas sp.]|nr:hypothetical protein [Rhodopseudomonas sp.]
MPAEALLAVIGGVAGVLASLATFAGFWLMIGGKLAKTEDHEREIAELENSMKDLRAARESDAKDFRLSLSAESQALSLYREMALEKFASYEAVTAIEKRLTAAQVAAEERQARSNAESEKRSTDSEKRLTTAIDRLTTQLDSVFRNIASQVATKPAR